MIVIIRQIDITILSFQSLYDIGWTGILNKNAASANKVHSNFDFFTQCNIVPVQIT